MTDCCENLSKLIDKLNKATHWGARRVKNSFTLEKEHKTDPLIICVILFGACGIK